MGLPHRHFTLNLTHPDLLILLLSASFSLILLHSALLSCVSNQKSALTPLFGLPHTNAPLSSVGPISQNRSPPLFSHFHLPSFILSQLSSFAWSTAMSSNLFLPTLLASYNISDCMFPCLESTYLLIPIRKKIPQFLTVANKVVHYFQLKYLPLPPSLPLSFLSLQPC